MAFARQSFTGDGVTNQYAVAFPYITRSHVKVEVNGVAAPFTWVNPSLIQITSTPSVGAGITIYRDSSVAARLVDYTAGPLDEAALDADSLQAFYLNQESRDTAEAALGTTSGDLAWDAASKQIKNVANGSDTQDAVTMGQLAAAAIAPVGVLPVANGGTGGTTQATARSGLGLGTAATLNAGTAAGNVPILAGASQLPALDGSLLTGVVAASVTVANVSGLGAYFHVNKNGTNQTGITNGSVNVLVTFSTEVADTANRFDTGTSRFTPGNGEVWLLTARFGFTTANDGQISEIALGRNGAIHLRGVAGAQGTGASAGDVGTWLVIGNGTDYYDIRIALSNSAATRDINGATPDTFFQGVRIK